MKVLYISGEVIPGNTGGAVHTWEVARHMVLQNHKVTLLVPSDQIRERKEIKDNIEIIRVPMKILNKTFPLMGIIFISPLFFRKFDLIIERFYSTGGIGSIYSILRGTPLILEVNNPHHEEVNLRYNLPKWFKKIVCWWSFFQFRTAWKILSPLSSIIPKIYQDKLVLTCWGVNTKLFNREKENEKRAKDIIKKYNLEEKVIVIYSGTFRSWHGINKILEIAKGVVNKNKKIIFFLIGSGDYYEDIKQKLKEYGINNNVILTGEINYEEMPYYLSISHMGIAPFDIKENPLFEKFGFYYSPLKIFEYMASELYILTTNIFPLNHLIEEYGYGKVIDNGIEEYIKEILKFQDMPKNIKKEMIDKYSWENHLKKFLILK